MNLNINDMMNSIMENLDRIDHIKPEDIPNIELYMDQVTTFMDSQLEGSKRFEDDKILTKTMINNYAKNKLLPAPSKKKYSKEHMLMLIFIYYFKNFLSIADIQSILTPLSDKYFQNTDGLSLEDIYREVFSMEKQQIDHIKEELLSYYRSSENTFIHESPEEQAFLKLFSFICLLSFDVYVKKQLIEAIIDSFPKK